MNRKVVVYSVLIACIFALVFICAICFPRMPIGEDTRIVYGHMVFIIHNGTDGTRLRENFSLILSNEYGKLEEISIIDGEGITKGVYRLYADTHRYMPGFWGYYPMHQLPYHYWVQILNQTIECNLNDVLNGQIWIFLKSNKG